jgi:Glycosyltransferase Family 4
MKIAQIAPQWGRVSPHETSEPERGLSYLVEELVRRGHEVTLFASADSQTSANLNAICTTPFYRATFGWNQAAARMRAIEQAFGKCAEKFDIIHSHVGIDGVRMAWRCVIPTLSTIQYRLDWPEYIPLFKQYRNLSLVSTSNAQRRPWLAL